MVALFDMDGVIFQGKNFWLDLHRIYDTEERALELAAELMKTDYELMSKITVEELWKGKPAEPFLKLVNERQYEEGVRELFEFLQLHNFKTGIVSSGPFQLARRAQEELGIDEIRSNYVHFENQQVAGTVEVNVPDDEKDRVGLDLISKFRSDPGHALFIGDEPSDKNLAREVGLSIAYNCNDTGLRNHATYELPRGRLLDAVQIIKSWCEKDAADFSV